MPDSRNFHEDQHYILQIKEGSEHAFRKLFYKYKDGLYGFAISLLKSKEVAEEVLQDTFMQVWLNREKIDENRNFKSYLYTIVKNQSFNILKKAAYELNFEKLLSHYQKNSTSNTLDYMINKEYEVLKKEAIAKLPEARREIFLMSREQGKSYKEISSELDISLNTVKSQMYKALKSLRVFFAESDDFNIILFIIYNSFF